MAFTVALTTDIGRVRLLIPDRSEAEAIFQDDEIQALLDLEGGSIKRAAALAKETIAGDELLVLKVVVTKDYETDGAAVARELRLQAQNLREQAADEGNSSEGLFDWAEMVYDPFSARQRLSNQALRNGY